MAGDRFKRFMASGTAYVVGMFLLVGTTVAIMFLAVPR